MDSIQLPIVQLSSAEKLESYVKFQTAVLKSTHFYVIQDSHLYIIQDSNIK